MRFIASLMLRLFGKRDKSLCERCQLRPGTVSVCPAITYLAGDSTCRCCDSCREVCRKDYLDGIGNDAEAN